MDGLILLHHIGDILVDTHHTELRFFLRALENLPLRRNPDPGGILMPQTHPIGTGRVFALTPGGEETEAHIPIVRMHIFNEPLCGEWQQFIQPVANHLRPAPVHYHLTATENHIPYPKVSTLKDQVEPFPIVPCRRYGVHLSGNRGDIDIIPLLLSLCRMGDHDIEGGTGIHPPQGKNRIGKCPGFLGQGREVIPAVYTTGEE
ncbi:hypothetical protein MKMG_02217 [Methanogenium sp. MK-MG]|nr:hypothetical protein MKMG_02217 [Methanogenium sp. MK-MG]